MKCDCNSNCKLSIVKKEGPNKGREFYHCATNKCKCFKWKDSKTYDPTKFKNGACFRCGYYGCEITDCNREFDWFGNKIPNDIELDE